MKWLRKKILRLVLSKDAYIICHSLVREMDDWEPFYKGIILKGVHHRYNDLRIDWSSGEDAFDFAIIHYNIIIRKRASFFSPLNINRWAIFLATTIWQKRSRASKPTRYVPPTIQEIFEGPASPSSIMKRNAEKIKEC